MRNNLCRIFVIALICAACQTVPPVASPGSTTAESSSSVDIQAAIDAASDGDVVTVPAGNATWTSSVTIPSNKGISLIGAGRGNTNITLGRYKLTIETREENSPVRISGFRFING
jgi:pectin methylesterase-like acyl-CoA thioesterase